MELDFDGFAREQLPSLARFAAALTGDAQLAEDLVQDTLVRVYTRLPRVATADRPDLADRARLDHLLGQLGRQQRAAIVLRFHEDRDDAEIAEVLGCAPATVGSHISRGLATLRLRAQGGNGNPIHGRAATARLTSFRSVTSTTCARCCKPVPTAPPTRSA